jgi:hypothetical protein
MLAQQFKPQLVRPPVAIGVGGGGSPVMEGTLGFGWHSFFCFVG